MLRLCQVECLFRNVKKMKILTSTHTPSTSLRKQKDSDRSRWHRDCLKDNFSANFLPLLLVPTASRLIAEAVVEVFPSAKDEKGCLRQFIKIVLRGSYYLQ